MKTIMCVLLAGTVISASAMASVAGNDKKILNSLEDKKVESLTSTDTGMTKVSLVATGEKKKTANLDQKIDEMFVAADLNVDGVLTEAEYVEYQANKARTKFASMAGDDNQLNIEEVKDWYATQQSASTSVDKGASQ